MQNSIKFLLVFLLLLIVTSYILLKDSPEENLQVTAFAELKENINKIDELKLSKNTQQLDFYIENGSWRLKQADGYLADINKIAETLISLSQMNIKSKKTNHPEKHKSLELESSGEYSGVSVMALSSQKELVNSIFGKSDSTGEAIYFRNSNDSQTYLVNGNPTFNLSSDYWILKSIMNISSNDVLKVEFTTGAENFSIQRVSESDFSLLPLAADEEIKSQSDINNLANGLSQFSIDSARQKGGLVDLNKIRTIEYSLIDNSLVAISLFEKDEEYFIMINSSGQHSGLNQNLSEWLFQIPKFKFDALNPKLTTLITNKAVDEKPLEAVE